MRRRLYFLLPDVKSARQVFKKLLLARIEDRHIFFLAKEGVELSDLPEATMLQKSDEIHGLGVGLVVGGATGALAGVVAMMFPPSGLVMGLGVILAMSLIGAIVGVWASGMIASDVPNTRLEKFSKEIESGKILLMVDIHKHQIEEITGMLREQHPDAAPRGRDPTIPAFP
ncbi:MAG: hypothetical protein WB402_12820 [Sulfuricaulis sp.]|uniref:DUF1269 domain-containing protein n=1 Tax=Sulfuricaulis sp. TaxID=2003553 RepID=UPI003C3215BB